MEVAVKTLKNEATEEETVKFLQEAAIQGQFQHPNIVKLIGVVTVGQPVSVMPLTIGSYCRLPLLSHTADDYIGICYKWRSSQLLRNS